MLVGQHALDIFFLGIAKLIQNFGFILIFERSHICYARPYFQNLFIVSSKQLYILPHFWSWTDQAHLSLEHMIS